MPTLAPNIEKSVFYLYRKEPDNTFTSAGTGFLVSRSSKDLPFTWHIYAVSNRHVVQGDAFSATAGSCLRLNTKKGDTRFLDFEPTDWVCAEQDDLAALDVTDHLNWCSETGMFLDDISFVDEHTFAQQPYSGASTVSLGDQTIMLGLFASHMRASRNIPVARFGNIAALASDDNLVRLTSMDRFSRPSFLNDMRSRDGFSGSPVWVWQTKYDDMNNHWGTGFFPSVAGRDRSALILAGVHRGQFPDKVQITLHDGVRTQAEIPSSMTVVVPAWEIAKLINNPIFQAMAEQRDKCEARKRYSNEVCSIIKAREISLRGE